MNSVQNMRTLTLAFASHFLSLLKGQFRNLGNLTELGYHRDLLDFKQKTIPELYCEVKCYARGEKIVLESALT